MAEGNSRPPYEEEASFPPSSHSPQDPPAKMRIQCHFDNNYDVAPQTIHHADLSPLNCQPLYQPNYTYHPAEPTSLGYQSPELYEQYSHLASPATPYQFGPHAECKPLQADILGAGMYIPSYQLSYSYSSSPITPNLDKPSTPIHHAWPPLYPPNPNDIPALMPSGPPSLSTTVSSYGVTPYSPSSTIYSPSTSLPSTDIIPPSPVSPIGSLSSTGLIPHSPVSPVGSLSTSPQCPLSSSGYSAAGRASASPKPDRRMKRATARAPRGESTFYCLRPGCGKGFGRAHDLTRHVRCVHCKGGGRFYDCEDANCRRKGYSKATGRGGFKRRDKQRDHMREMHGMDIPKKLNKRSRAQGS